MITPHVSLQYQLKTARSRRAGTREVTESKLLRLIFHDCIPYADGSGGCDGCMNWEGVGVRFTNPKKWEYQNVGKTNNNGLEWTVDVLEHVYTNPQFP